MIKKIVSIGVLGVMLASVAITNASAVSAEIDVIPVEVKCLNISADKGVSLQEDALQMSSIDDVRDALMLPSKDFGPANIINAGDESIVRGKKSLKTVEINGDVYSASRVAIEGNINVFNSFLEGDEVYKNSLEDACTELFEWAKSDESVDLAEDNPELWQESFLKLAYSMYEKYDLLTYTVI